MSQLKSIKARLKNYSKKHNKTHQFTLIRYFQERLLYRLSKSQYKNQFLLKGGALIYSLNREASRPTLDIDLLAKGISTREENIKKIFAEICNVKSFDGVDFDPNNISISEILKEGNYSGVRVKIPATLDNIKQSMQIDLGFGDVVTPGPVEMEYPTIIAMDSPKLLAYSIESLVAEKFHAMISLAEYNSRMKDFYDIFTILQSKNYNPTILPSAIKNTFEKRKTVFIKDHSLFTDEFHQDQDRNKQWKAFLKKAKLPVNIDFYEVMKLIKQDLKPIYEQL